LSVLESVAHLGLRGSQRPGLLHLPEGSDAYTEDAFYLLGEWGFDYDDWQRFTMRCALLEQPDGRWAAKEFGLEIPRQNGKGEEIEGREALGLFYFDERKLIHSAHEFATASEALDRMDDRIGQNPQLKRRVKSVKRSHGEEGVYLKDGRKLLYKTRTKGGGRGFSADLLILDEAMFLAEAFLGALMPVISARANPQMWYTGSAVDQEKMEHGVVFARLRQRALDGKPGRMAYLGWSPAYGRDEWRTPADVPEEATADPQVIAEGNPALGIRIDLEHIVETEREAMDHRTFCAERLGVGDWPALGADEGDEISRDQWAACEDPNSSAVDPVAFAFDVRPDRQTSAVSVAGVREDGLRHVEVLEHKSGTRWVLDYLKERVERHDCGPVLFAANSPAAALKKGLVESGIPFEEVSGPDFAQACGSFVDDVVEGELRHRVDLSLAAAVRGAAKRPLGDSWAWSRKNSAVDISPLVACTLARFAVAGDRPSVYEQRGVLVV
jgi:hypothetical protein